MVRRFVRFQDGTRSPSEKNMLKLRSIGISDYSVLEGRQRIGRIRFIIERLLVVECHRPPERALPMGSSKDSTRTRTGPITGF